VADAVGGTPARGNELMTTPIRAFAIWLSVGAALVAADPPATAPPLESLVLHARTLEKESRWQQAADVYERALRLHGERPDVRECWRTAEQRHNLSRRYHDPSFAHDLLELPTESALELQQEILRKIDAYYVEQVDHDRLVRAGYRQLATALSEPCFVDRCVRPELKGSLDQLRTILAHRPLAPISDATGAVEEAREAARLAEPYFSRPTGVVLEFISAACETLDPYSSHLSPQRLRDLYAMIDGNFVGLGVEVRGEKNGLRILSVVPDSPAAKAGVQEGDVITDVDGRTLKGMPTEEAANTLQGPDGSAVRLVVERGGKGGVCFSLIRREVVVHSVTASEIIDASRRLAYVKLASFQKQTATEVRTAINKLSQPTPLGGLILDLRGNPGGLLDSAVQVANQFVGEGVMVRTRGRAWGQSWNHEVAAQPMWRFPLAVLVDGDSASASEILAGAIRDHRRGVLVGTRTYGKGSVQSIFPLQSQRTGLRLTTAKFFSPNDHAFELVGVQPDVVVPRRIIDAFGEEEPAPKRPTLDKDGQLAAAVRALTQQAVATR
jgi:carboxyl-terminal processing protease